MPEWSSCFPYFLQFQSEFGNKEFMIWATVSSWSCFCWLYRASPSLAAKNIINLISVLTIWWCPYVESCVVGRGYLPRPVRSLGKTYFGSVSSFFLELFLHWPPGAYWAPTDLGSSSFSILSFCLFILFMGFSRQTHSSNNTFQRHKRRLYTWTSPDGQHRNLIIFFAAKDGEALYSQQKEDQELTVAQIMNSLLPNSNLNWRK